MLQQGPVFPEPLNEPSDLTKLTVEGAVSRLTYVGEAITMMRHLLDGKVPLIGFTGAPVCDVANNVDVENLVDLIHKPIKFNCFSGPLWDI